MSTAGRPPGKKIMTLDEMKAMELARTETNLFSRDEDSEAKIRKLIATTTTELANLPEKVDLKNTELVKSISKAYLLSCYEAGTVPSKIGMCRGLGMSRQGVDTFMAKNPDHSTTAFLSVLFDSLADMLSNAALTNSVNLVLSIFLLKSVFGYKEGFVLETPAPGPLGAVRSPEEIEALYRDLPEE